MKTVLILALIAAACVCSDDSSETEFEEDGCKSMVSPNASSSQKPDENRENEKGATKTEWQRMTLSEQVLYHSLLDRFVDDEEGELQGMCNRFQEEKGELRHALDNTRPQGRLPSRDNWVVDREDYLKRIFCYILLGLGSCSDRERAGGEYVVNRAAKRVYSTVALFAAKYPVHETVKEVLDALRKVYIIVWSSDRNDSQDASELSEGSQRKENEEGAIKTKWQRMTPSEQAYHGFVVRFWENKEAELQRMYKQLKVEGGEKMLNRLLNSPRPQRLTYGYVSGRKKYLKQVFCYITGLEILATDIIDEKMIKRVYRDIELFTAGSCPKDEKHEEVIGAMRKILRELKWDPNDQKTRQDCKHGSGGLPNKDSPFPSIRAMTIK
jgi:hypothetical protein